MKVPQAIRIDTWLSSLILKMKHEFPSESRIKVRKLMQDRSSVGLPEGFSEAFDSLA